MRYQPSLPAPSSCHFLIDYLWGLHMTKHLPCCISQFRMLCTVSHSFRFVSVTFLIFKELVGSDGKLESADKSCVLYSSNWPSRLIKSLRILQVLLKSSEDCNIPIFLWGKSSWCCSRWMNSMVKWWRSVDEQSPVKWKSSEADGQILLLEGQPSCKM